MPQYRIADQNVLLIHGRKVVVVVDDQTDARQAFYQSKGKGGSAVKGQWVPFSGFDFVPQLGGTFFIKHPEGKTFPPDSELGQIADWLSAQELEVTYAPEMPVWWHCRSLSERLELINEMVRVNTALGAMGAPERFEEPRLTEPRATDVRNRIREVCK